MADTYHTPLSFTLLRFDQQNSIYLAYCLYEV